MDKQTAPSDALRQILRHVRHPESLDDHPWTRALIVQEARACTPELEQASPGQQLVSAIVGLFPQLQPAAPPKRGKRLDPRWGEFGLLAALYFTPYSNGKSFPTSLMDAWGRIDPAILYFVFGKPAEALGQEQVERYELVGADLEYAAVSTLSDWHKKGLQRLTEIILDHERFLSRTSAGASIILDPVRARLPAAAGHAGPARARSRPRPPGWLRAAALLALVIVLGLGTLKAWKIYQSALPVYQHLTRLRELVEAPLELQDFQAAVPVLQTLQADLPAFEEQARPLLWLAPRLDWAPVYGPDLAAAPALMDLAGHLLDASLISYQAARPLLDEFES
ncbi:MAG TPA: hypothetical protein VI410_00080, partial [Anaerolineales bacterium]|nr:hypothetical protein [Anaerolineales bacterium]